MKIFVNIAVEYINNLRIETCACNNLKQNSNECSNYNNSIEDTREEKKNIYSSNNTYHELSINIYELLHRFITELFVYYWQSRGNQENIEH